jgi:hypothetical protein
MRRVDVRVYVIGALIVCAAGLAAYRMKHPSHARGEQAGAVFAAPVVVSPERVRAMVDTTAKLLGAPKKYLTRRSGVDSGRVVLETAIGVPAAFDEIRLMTMLTDSLRAGGITVGAAKNLKEKTTTIRFRDRDNTCIYRCILYRKELPH